MLSRIGRKQKILVVNIYDTHAVKLRYDYDDLEMPESIAQRPVT